MSAKRSPSAPQPSPASSVQPTHPVLRQPQYAAKIQSPPPELISTVIGIILSYPPESLASMCGPLVMDLGYNDPTRHLNATSLGNGIRAQLLDESNRTLTPETHAILTYYFNVLQLWDPNGLAAYLCRHACMYHLRSCMFDLVLAPSPQTETVNKGV